MVGESLRLGMELGVEPLRVWRAVTDSRELAGWWGEGIVLEPWIGGRFVEPWMGEDGSAQCASGAVVLAEEPREIVFTWRERFWPETAMTTCAFRLAPKGPGCEFTIEHWGWDCFPSEKAEALKKAFSAGWTFHLGNLKAWLATGNL